MIFLYRDTGGKGKNQIFHHIFLNKDISITDKDIDMKFCMVLLHTYCEGRVSQIFYLALVFILCYLEYNVSKIPKKLPGFFLYK